MSFEIRSSRLHEHCHSVATLMFNLYATSADVLVQEKWIALYAMFFEVTVAYYVLTKCARLV